MPDVPELGPEAGPGSALLRLCLRAWPAQPRTRLGPGLIAAALEAVREARDRSRWAGLRELVGEAVGIVRSGLGLRWAGWNRATGKRLGGWTMGWRQDVRFGIRTWMRSPGFAAVAVGTLALGIGADTAVFSLVDGVLMRAPPYERPDELVLVWNALPDSEERIPVAGPDAAALKAGADRFAELAFSIRGVDGALQTGAEHGAEPVRIASVSTAFFDVLGAEAALGRTFGSSDRAAEGAPERPTAPSVVVADRVWRSVLGSDPAVVGRTVRLNGVPATVVGVMPPGFRLVLPPDAGVMTDVDVWLPLTVPLAAFHRDPERLLDQDSDNTGVVVARLTSGSSIGQAQEQADRVARTLRAEVPAYAAAGLGFSVRSLHEDATAHARPVLLALLAGAAGVLLVACLNLGTLLLARGVARDRELAIRACLGAGRGRLLRQLGIEGAVLSVAGLVSALVGARLLLDVLTGVIPPALMPPDGPVLDIRAFGFAAVTSVLSVLLFAVLPGARATRREARGAVGARVIRSGPGGAGPRRLLVGAQVALSLVLVLGSGLLLRTVSALDAVRPGFDPEGVLTFSVSLRVPGTYRGPSDRAAYMDEVARSLAALPGVRSVGLVGGLPLSGDRWTQPYGLPGQAESKWRENRADFRVVSSGYFEAMGIRVVEGRTFTPHEDLQEEERVVVVDELLAARLAPRGSALDRVVGIPLDGRAVQARVVGVVEHVRHERLEADGREAVYVPYRQEASRDVSFVLRVAGPPEELGPTVNATLRGIDPRIPVHGLRTLEAYVNEAVAPRRFALVMLAGFSVLALLCAAVGLYGVVAHDVSRRTRDIGVQLAMGAEPGRVERSMLMSGARTGLLGMAAGLLLAGLAAFALRGLVFGVTASDPVTWIAVVALVSAMTLLATWLPARRAARLSPTEALRPE